MASLKDIKDFRKFTTKTVDDNGCTINCINGTFAVSYKDETACMKEAFWRFEKARDSGVYESSLSSFTSHDITY